MDSLDLPSITPPSPLYRIGRKPDPWRAPDWAHCQDDLTFGNRFDDANGQFRVIYASSSRLGCFIETLSRFRTPSASSHLAVGLKEILNSADDFTPVAHVPVSWLDRRLIGTAECRKLRFAEVYSSEWLAFLRRTLDRGHFRQASQLGQDLDLAALMSQQRKLTQQIASMIYENGYDGVCYESRHGTDLLNWALFEPYELHNPVAQILQPEDSDFINALHCLHLGLALNL